MFDIVIAGAGLSGSVFARLMAERGKKILVLERRNHIAGNLYDERNKEGIRIQKYGPHIFHTNNQTVYDFIGQYAHWDPFRLRCQVKMCDISTPSPFNFTTIDQFYSVSKAQRLKKRLQEFFPAKKSVTIVELLQSEDQLIKEYAQMLFDHDYSLYTAKQWGISVKEIDISVLERVPVRLDYEDGYFSDLYECMPEKGYSEFIASVLDHENIEVRLEVDALAFISLDEASGKICFKGMADPKEGLFVYTGAIDELFNYCFGNLPYRSLYFEYKTLFCESFQEAPVVAYPEAADYTRITEYKKLPEQRVTGITTIAYEYPVAYTTCSATEPYYPVPNPASKVMYNQYAQLAKSYSNLILCGRLAEFRYYNMDQAIESIFHKISKLA